MIDEPSASPSVQVSEVALLSAHLSGISDEDFVQSL
jgi:hypothetical protein